MKAPPPPVRCPEGGGVTRPQGASRAGRARGSTAGPPPVCSVVAWPCPRSFGGRAACGAPSRGAAGGGGGCCRKGVRPSHAPRQPWCCLGCRGCDGGAVKEVVRTMRPPPDRWCGTRAAGSPVAVAAITPPPVRSSEVWPSPPEGLLSPIRRTPADQLNGSQRCPAPGRPRAGAIPNTAAGFCPPLLPPSPTERGCRAVGSAPAPSGTIDGPHAPAARTPPCPRRWEAVGGDATPPFKPFQPPSRASKPRSTPSACLLKHRGFGSPSQNRGGGCPPAPPRAVTRGVSRGDCAQENCVSSNMHSQKEIKADHEPE